MNEISKDADKLICCVYKTYLERRKDGMSKEDAKQFYEGFHTSDEKLSKWIRDDISETLLELQRAKYIRLDLSENFRLTDSLIIYMEQRFKNGLLDVVDLVSKFI